MCAASFAAFLYDESDRLDSIPRRVYRDRRDAFALSEREFIQYFRLNKQCTLQVIERIKTMLPTEGLSPHIRVLAALRFYATGSYQHSIGNDMFLGLSQKTVSRCIQAVSHAIMASMMGEFVKFPDVQEQQEIKRRFYSSYGLPGIIGCIDCTHVAVMQPTDDSERMSLSYLNRKGFYSINVQLISDDTLKIRACSARYPGSVHDAFIWRHSGIKSHIRRQQENGNSAWLLGDSGYPLEPWLLTPFLDPASPDEETFNTKHASARNVIERCNGVLKSRFRCLLRHRVLNYDPTHASYIINACIILHNLCLQHNLIVDEEIRNDDDDDDQEEEDQVNSVHNMPNLQITAQRLRKRIALAL